MKTFTHLLWALICTAICIFWVFDILNFPQMEMFDTEFPINTLAWSLIFIILGCADEEVDKIDRNDKVIQIDITDNNKVGETYDE